MQIKELSQLMNEEEKLLAAKANDLFRLCDKYASARFSGFLNEAQAELIRTQIGEPTGYNTGFFGGYDEAERCIFSVFPDWEECVHDKFPIVILKFIKGYSKELSHRDYLGTILSLGIERGKVGDIVVTDKGAYAFVMEDIADYIADNITKIANCGVKTEKLSINDEIDIKKAFKIVNTIAASPRLDAILASAFNLSRREASLLINAGRVSINHKESLNTSMILKNGDLISARGFGRVILEELGSSTRSGKIHISLKKYE